MIYFDTCALLKLIRADAQSAALGAFIDARPGDPLVLFRDS